MTRELTILWDDLRILGAVVAMWFAPWSLHPWATRRNLRLRASAIFSSSRNELPVTCVPSGMYFFGVCMKVPLSIRPLISHLLEIMNFVMCYLIVSFLGTLLFRRWISFRRSALLRRIGRQLNLCWMVASFLCSCSVFLLVPGDLSRSMVWIVFRVIFFCPRSFLKQLHRYWSQLIWIARSIIFMDAVYHEWGSCWELLSLADFSFDLGPRRCLSANGSFAFPCCSGLIV